MNAAARVGSVRGARRVRHRDGAEADQRGGQQPGDVGTHPVAEQPPPADVEVHVAEPAGLVAGQPAETVVAQRQFDDAVVLRSTDVRPRRRRPQLDEQPGTSPRRPPSPRPGRRRREAGGRSGRLPGRPGTPRRSRAAPGTPAASWRGSRSPTAAPAATNHQRLLSFFACALRAVGARDQGEHQQRVGVVEPEHQRRDRRQRQDRAGEQRGAGPADPPHGGVEQRDRGHPLQRLRHQHAPRVQPEDAHRDVHDPQRRRASCRR